MIKNTLLIIFLFLFSFCFGVDLEKMVDNIYCHKSAENLEVMEIQPKEKCDSLSDYDAALYYLYQGRYSQKIYDEESYTNFMQDTINGNFSKLKKYTPDLKKTVALYASALEKIEQAMKKEPENTEYIALKAEILSYYGILGNFSHLVKHGLAINPLAKKALKKDEKNIRAKAIKAYTKAFSTPFFGGNIKESKNLLSELLLIEETLTRDQKFNTYTTLAYIHIRQGDTEGASQYIEKANQLYPNSVLLSVLRNFNENPSLLK